MFALIGVPRGFGDLRRRAICSRGTGEHSKSFRELGSNLIFGGIEGVLPKVKNKIKKSHLKEKPPFRLIFFLKFLCPQDQPCQL